MTTIDHDKILFLTAMQLVDRIKSLKEDDDITSELILKNFESISQRFNTQRTDEILKGTIYDGIQKMLKTKE